MDQNVSLLPQRKKPRTAPLALLALPASPALPAQSSAQSTPFPLSSSFDLANIDPQLRSLSTNEAADATPSCEVAGMPDHGSITNKEDKAGEMTQEEESLVNAIATNDFSEDQISGLEENIMPAETTTLGYPSTLNEFITLLSEQSQDTRSASGTYKCPVLSCDYTSSRNDYLMEHFDAWILSEKHTFEDITSNFFQHMNLVCKEDGCTEKFFSIKFRKQHQFDKHTTFSPRRCPKEYCLQHKAGFLFKTLKEFTNHAANHINGFQPTRCLVPGCTKLETTFQMENQLKKHLSSQHSITGKHPQYKSLMLPFLHGLATTPAAPTALTTPAIPAVPDSSSHTTSKE